MEKLKVFKLEIFYNYFDLKNHINYILWYRFELQIFRFE